MKGSSLRSGLSLLFVLLLLAVLGTGAMADAAEPQGVSVAAVDPPSSFMEPATLGAWINTGPGGGKAHALAVSPAFAEDGVAFSGEWLTNYQLSESGLGILRSADGGQSWTISSGGISESGPSSAVHDYAFSPGFAQDSTVFAATWGGLFKSSNGGALWQRVEGSYGGDSPGYVAVAVAPNYAQSGHLLASTWGQLAVRPGFNEAWKTVEGFSGAVDLAYSPTFAADQTAFAASAGLLRTTDGGLTWSQPLSASVASLAVSPNFATDQTLFAAGDILYTSTDGGASWSSSPIAGGIHRVAALAISPHFGADRTLFAGTDRGLYGSEDGGASWQPLNTERAVSSLAISPEWPDHPVLLVGTAAGVYRLAGTELGPGMALTPGGPFANLASSPLAWSAVDDLLLAGTSNHGIYASRDGGHEWEPLGLQEGHSYNSYSDIAISPNFDQDETIFAAQLGYRMGSSLYRTLDGGATWDYVYSSDFVTDIAISPAFASDHTVYAASNEKGIVGSTSGGDKDSWSQVGSWPGAFPSGAAQYISLPPTYPQDSTLFAGGSQGFWRLPGGAATWQQAASGLVDGYYVFAIAVSPAYEQNELLLASAQLPDTGSGNHYALFRSLDGGVNWQRAGIGLPDVPLRGLAFSLDPGQEQVAYTSAETGEVYRSTDGGRTWVLLGSAPGAPGLRDVMPLPKGRLFVASNTGVWRHTSLFNELIVNGGFEGYDPLSPEGDGWNAPATAYPAAYTDQVVRSGQQAARVGVPQGSNVYSYSSLYQTVAIPGNAQQALLDLYLYPSSEETNQAGPAALTHDGARAPVAGDAQYLLIYDANGTTLLETLFFDLLSANGWQHHTFDLSGYAGQTVRLHFEVYNDGLNGSTRLYVDDVSLYISTVPLSPLYLPLIRTK